MKAKIWLDDKWIAVTVTPRFCNGVDALDTEHVGTISASDVILEVGDIVYSHPYSNNNGRLTLGCDTTKHVIESHTILEIRESTYAETIYKVDGRRFSLMSRRSMYLTRESARAAALQFLSTMLERLEELVRRVSK